MFPDPEIPVISLTDLGIIRDVAWDDDTLVVTVTPTYTGCPATTAINLDIEKALRAKGIAKLELKRQISPAWTTDWISAEGREKLRAYGIAPPIDGSACRWPNSRARVNRMTGGRTSPFACPRCGSTHTDEGQPVRLDALQGQLPLQRLPRALRLFQVHLSGCGSTDMARFHPLDVVDVRRETRDAVVVTLKPRDADAALFDFTQGQYLTFRRKFDGDELRRSYSICAGKGEGLAASRHQARRRRRLLDLGQRGTDGRRGHRSHATHGPFLHADRA